MDMPREDRLKRWCIWLRHVMLSLIGAWEQLVRHGVVTLCCYTVSTQINYIQTVQAGDDLFSSEVALESVNESRAQLAGALAARHEGNPTGKPSGSRL